MAAPLCCNARASFPLRSSMDFESVMTPPALQVGKELPVSHSTVLACESSGPCRCFIGAGYCAATPRFAAGAHALSVARQGAHLPLVRRLDRTRTSRAWELGS